MKELILHALDSIRGLLIKARPVMQIVRTVHHHPRENIFVVMDWLMDAKR